MSSSFSRRDVIGQGLGLAAMGAAGTGRASTTGPRRRGRKPVGPFDTLRDYVAALEAHGLVVRIPRVDQDAYEGTALMYRFRDLYGMNAAPALLFDEVRVNGEWLRGPVIVNESGHLLAENIAFGLPHDRRDLFANYRAMRSHWGNVLAANGGAYPLLPPVEVAREQALCKEVVLTGDAIDLTRFAFVQGNPFDAGRYINTAMVFTRDPEQGVNIGTYRCHLRGPRELGVNPEPLQTGWRHLTAARDRGEKTARVVLALSPDPAVWLVSGSVLTDRRAGQVDELALAGGLRGRPVAVVRAETADFLVPATAEMIIEGEIPLDDLRPEGPYGEMYGYQGLRKEQNFWMRVTTVTHRRSPWLMNNFTGVNRGFLMTPSHGFSFYRLQQRLPVVVDYFGDNRAVGCAFVSIRKSRPGEGLEVARRIAEDNFFAKVVVVVDEDVDVTSQEQVLSALGSRWQPAGATHTYEALAGMPLDPSAPRRGRTSKIAIDATRRWPEEGGPAVFPEPNLSLLREGAPEAFARVEERYGDLIRGWPGGRGQRAG